MRWEEAIRRIQEAGGDEKVFSEWMRGQTVGLNEDGTQDIYEHDVKRFIRYKCAPKNEPIEEWD